MKTTKNADTDTVKVRLRGEGGHVFAFTLPMKRVFADQVRAKKLVPVDDESYELVADLLVARPTPTRAELRRTRGRRGNAEPVEETDEALPPVDPEEGHAAAIAADAARDELLQELTAGEVDVTDVFADVDDEDGHAIGHIHLRALLLALPGIGDVHADEILEALDVPADEHIDVLGPDQRATLYTLVAAAETGEPDETEQPAGETETAEASEPVIPPESPSVKWPETHAKLDELAKKLRVKFPDPVGKKRLTVDEKIAALEQAGKKPPKQ